MPGATADRRASDSGHARFVALKFEHRFQSGGSNRTPRRCANTEDRTSPVSLSLTFIHSSVGVGHDGRIVVELPDHNAC